MNSNLKLLPAALLVAVLALAGCGGGSDSEPVDPGPTAEQKMIMDLQAEIAALRTQLGLSADGNIGETVAELQAQLKELQDAKDAADEKAKMDAEAGLMATAKKLLAGISAPGGTGEDTRTAAYGTGDNANDIAVTIGTATAVNLSEDKKTMVNALHGWAGKRYTRTTPASEGMYEAMVYSNVEAPTRGKKFGGAAANDEFEYALTDGALAIDTATTAVQARVALSGVTRTAGTETFKLPDPNPSGATVINVPGSHHGVAGTYRCTPTDAAVGCTASVAASGFTLGDGTWTFAPTDPNARVMDSADTVYASYGWWIHKAANDGAFTASAFAADKGNVPDATGITALQGSATYMGGAAGKYALHSATGGTNDAGHFTAAATLEANFTDDTVTGTIDNFMGADGMMRDWSVELKKSTVGDGGAIAGDPATSGNTDAQMTVWTIGGTAAAAAGEWSGSLQNNGDDSVPKVASGTFHSTYGTAGEMVGGFGANKQ